MCVCLYTELKEREFFAHHQKTRLNVSGYVVTYVSESLRDSALLCTMQHIMQCLVLRTSKQQTSSHLHVTMHRTWWNKLQTSLQLYIYISNVSLPSSRAVYMYTCMYTLIHITVCIRRYTYSYICVCIYVDISFTALWWCWLMAATIIHCYMLRRARKGKRYLKDLIKRISVYNPSSGTAPQNEDSMKASMLHACPLNFFDATLSRPKTLLITLRFD